VAWYELAENPKAITSLFSRPESFDIVSLFAVELDREGPTVRARFNLEQFPDRPPKKWGGHDYNRAQVRLDFFGIESLVVSGWSTTNVCHFDVNPAGRRLAISFVSEAAANVRFTTLGFRIAQIDAYVDTSR
jgi:hypothetical protein